MDSRMSLIDLNVNLVLMQYGKQELLEDIHELLLAEFPQDNITIDELTKWASLLWEVEELERSFDYYYSKEEII